MTFVFLAAVAAAAPTPLDFASGPAASASRVEASGAGLCLVHAAPGGVAERNRLWVAYVRWLHEQGYVAAREDHVVPWQRVRWQRFEREDGSLELQVRRSGGAETWRVLLIPKRPGSPW